MEGFFGLFKKEFWHGRDWSDWTPARFIEELGGWIGRYNTERCSDALGGRTPAELRSALGRAALRSKKSSAVPILAPLGWLLVGACLPQTLLGTSTANWNFKLVFANNL